MKAVALFSGGLDSMLSIRVIKDQGIDVVALNFDIGFEKSDKSEFRKKICENLGVELRILDIKKQFFDEVLFDPQYGYGKYFNPCIDCHANMIRHAKSVMEEIGASFIITGEVVGQRPKSQRAEALKQVNKISEADGYILRPLSAKLLEPTIPEKEGWVDREKLYGISGRGRQKQLELTKKFGITEFAPPAGGCMLTEDNQTQKIRDILELGSFEVEDIPLIFTGRYFVLPDGARLVVSRNKDENEILESISSDKFTPFEPQDIVGPTSAISKNSSPNDRELALKITLAYGKSDKERKYSAKIDGENITATPLESVEKAQEYFLVSQ